MQRLTLLLLLVGNSIFANFQNRIEVFHGLNMNIMNSTGDGAYSWENSGLIIYRDFGLFYAGIGIEHKHYSFDIYNYNIGTQTPAPYSFNLTNDDLGPLIFSTRMNIEMNMNYIGFPMLIGKDIHISSKPLRLLIETGITPNILTHSSVLPYSNKEQNLMEYHSKFYLEGTLGLGLIHSLNGRISLNYRLKINQGLTSMHKSSYHTITSLQTSFGLVYSF